MCFLGLKTLPENFDITVCNNYNVAEYSDAGCNSDYNVNTMAGRSAAFQLFLVLPADVQRTRKKGFLAALQKTAGSPAQSPSHLHDKA